MKAAPLRRSFAPLLGVCLLAAGPAAAETLRAAMAQATMQGPGAGVGTVEIVYEGVPTIVLRLHGLAAGPYVLEVHEGGSCANGYESHPGPEGVSPLMPVPAGEAGLPEVDRLGLDRMPLIVVGADGAATREILKPFLPRPADLTGHALLLRGNDSAPLYCGLLK